MEKFAWLTFWAIAITMLVLYFLWVV